MVKYAVERLLMCFVGGALIGLGSKPSPIKYVALLGALLFYLAGVLASKEME